MEVWISFDLVAFPNFHILDSKSREVSPTLMTIDAIMIRLW